MYTAVRRLKDSGVTIFILLAISEDAVDLLEEADQGPSGFSASGHLAGFGSFPNFTLWPRKVRSDRPANPSALPLASAATPTRAEFDPG